MILDELKKAGLETCLLKFKDLLKVVPGKEGEPINWKELSAHKDAAQKALNQLMTIINSETKETKLVGCKFLDPSYDIRNSTNKES